jgi:Uma2 family endonuclease
MSIHIARRSFTVDEYERMGELGIISPGERMELIEGEIVEMSPIGERHAACVDALAELLRERLQRTVNIRVQNPLRLDEHSEPQPDIAVLRRRDDFYRSAHPAPADVLLLVEVSDTTLEYDRQVKLPLYARAGVPEVWIVNLPDERVETYSDPSGGAYQLTRSAARGEEVEARNVAGLRLAAADILG